MSLSEQMQSIITWLAKASMESLVLSKQLLYLTLHTGIVWPSIELYTTHDKYTTIQLTSEESLTFPGRMVYVQNF